MVSKSAAEYRTRIAESVLPHAGAVLRGAAVLPDDGVVDRLAGGLVPDHHRLALVGDADRRHLGRRQAGGVQHVAADGQRVGPDVLGIVLDPAVGRIELLQLALRHLHDPPFAVEQDGAAAGGPLVDRQDVARRQGLPPSFLRAGP